MWGSTKANTPDECTWANAPFNDRANEYNSTYFNEAKNTVCPNGILAKEYDAAAQIMGEGWRMPTQSDFQELIDNTNKEWTIVNGVNGYKFTSNKEGFQNNSIFIPAAGSCSYGSVNLVDNDGYVWSSSLDTSGPVGAWYLSFRSGRCYMDSNYRCNGRSVRGVRK